MIVIVIVIVNVCRWLRACVACRLWTVVPNRIVYSTLVI